MTHPNFGEDRVRELMRWEGLSEPMARKYERCEAIQRAQFCAGGERYFEPATAEDVAIFLRPARRAWMYDAKYSCNLNV